MLSASPMKGNNKKGQNENQKPHAHLHIITKSTKFQTNPMKDVRGVVGKRFRKDVRTDGKMKWAHT